MNDRELDIIQEEIEARIALAKAKANIISDFSVGGVVFRPDNEVTEDTIDVCNGIEVIAEMYNRTIEVNEEKLIGGEISKTYSVYVEGMKFTQTEFHYIKSEVPENA